MNRHCDRCGRYYYRSNSFKSWPKRNPGARAGWLKSQISICLDCMSPAQTARMLMIVSVTVTKTGAARRIRQRRSA